MPYILVRDRRKELDEKRYIIYRVEGYPNNLKENCWRVLLCTHACGHRALSWLRVRPDWMSWLVGLIRKTTVRLLTHVLCKPIQLFFHSFIAAMPYSLQTGFSSVMKDWADNYHVWVTLQGQTRGNSNARVFHTQKEHVYMCSYIISLPYLQRNFILKCCHGLCAMYACMYSLIGNGQSAQKRPCWGENRIQRNI